MVEKKASRRGWTRRRVLGVGLVASGLVAGGFWRSRGYPQAQQFRGLSTLSPRAGVILMRVTDALLPPSADRSPAALLRYVRDMDQFLVGMRERDIGQLHLLLYAMEHVTLPHGLQRFSSLSLGQRRALLSDWQTSLFSIRRLGFQSLKTLVFMAYYRTPKAFRMIGYSGPIVTRGYRGPEESQRRYDPLLAPTGQEPQFG